MSADMAIPLTPEAVHGALAGAGFPAARMEGAAPYRRPVTQGFHTFRLPVTMEDRVAVVHHTGHYDPPGESAALGSYAGALEAAGYQTKYVAELVSGYLVVWVEGEF